MAEAEKNSLECPFDFKFALLWKRLGLTLAGRYVNSVETGAKDYFKLAASRANVY